MNDQPQLIKSPPWRRVFGRVKGVEINLAVDPANAPAIMKHHVFELRKDGLWFRRKHFSQWTKVGFAGLVAEARRQKKEADAAARAKWEDPRQMNFLDIKKDEQRSLNI